jgi:hypothetical protein
VYLLKTKDEAFNYFKTYKAEVENQLERKIKLLRSDRGGEYFSNVFDEFCVEHGICWDHASSLKVLQGETVSAKAAYT